MYMYIYIYIHTYIYADVCMKERECRGGQGHHISHVKFRVVCFKSPKMHLHSLTFHLST